MTSVDLSEIHRYDEETPIKETIRTLDEAVRRGQVRYIGASSIYFNRFTEARYCLSEEVSV